MAELARCLGRAPEAFVVGLFKHMKRGESAKKMEKDVKKRLGAALLLRGLCPRHS